MPHGVELGMQNKHAEKNHQNKAERDELTNKVVAYFEMNHMAQE